MLYRNSLSLSVFQCMLAIWSLVPLPSLKPAGTSGSPRFTYCWSLACRILSITLLACDRMKQGKDYRVLPRQPTGHNKHPLPTIQEKTLHMDITRWSIQKSDWLYFMQPKMQNSIQLAKTRPGADCGRDHELLIAKFRLKLKKVGKTTRPFRYDLN